MIDRTFTHRLISPADVSPSREGLRVVGVFNPGVAELNGEVVIVARVVEQPTDTQPGFVASPRLDEHGTLLVDHLAEDEYDLSDRRTVLHKTTAAKRLRFISHLRVFRSPDGKSIDPSAEPTALLPQGPYETYGIEDPRVTQLGDLFYITYVAVSPRGVCTCLMSTTDFVTFHRHGIILPPDNKDVVLFPEKLLGDYVAIHRPMPAIKFAEPAMWLSRSQNLLHWGAHERMDAADVGGLSIGGGTPPVRTRDGWLIIYHAKRNFPDAPDGEKRFEYVAHAMLLHPDNPRQVVGMASMPIMLPAEPFETHGFVDGVVFPTGIVERDDEFYVYYGAADEHVAVCGFDRRGLLAVCEPLEQSAAV
ncbi:MAG: hypothetical protein AAGI54_08875 [Planctomycetota bacterium]